tara:strand:+ start:20532 stop:21569 length:1038 start_codon:yes stop_codon:yes gene_type:complete
MDIKKQIKSQILSNNKYLRLDKFISYALYSKNGYYNNNKPIGKNKDFITAPEISQAFGEIIGIYLFYIWKTKIKSKFDLIELGPGKGTLFNDINNSVLNYPDFLNSTKVTFIEINKNLIKIQKQNIKNLPYNNIRWQKEINFKSKIPAIIYSNEFFDCFPVRQFILQDFWYEKYVGFNRSDDKFYIKDKKVENKKIISLLNNYKKEKILEISFERNKYFEKICKFIKNKGGLFFTIDYGYLTNIRNFTLQAIQNHKFSHVLENVGDKDISSHVNFNDFLNIAHSYKLNIEECCTQREFLIKYGILERVKNLYKFKNNKQISSQVDRLINNKEMGNLFKCLIISNL